MQTSVGVKNGVKNGLQLLIDAESFDNAYHHRGSKGFMIALADQVTVTSQVTKSQHPYLYVLGYPEKLP